MICVPIRGPSYLEASDQITQAAKFADLLELRLDFFDHIDLESIRKLQAAVSLPVIFTLKEQAEGETFKTIVGQLAALQPEYLDLESHADPQLIQKIQQDYPKIKLIFSFHDYSKTPENILGILKKMPHSQNSLFKIAVQAHSSLDALKLLGSAKLINHPFIAISMGQLGQISRILQPILGGYLTYVCLNEELKTAPGQLSFTTLNDCYNYRSLNSQTKIFGLIGDPVEQSLSHLSHNYYMREGQLNAVYVKVPLKPEELQEFFQYARKLPFSGLSVTMPLKEAIIPFLDFIDDEAKLIGACNTLVFKNEKILGYNTDGFGALNAIEKHMQVKGKNIVVLGAGGAAKAIIYEACKRGAIVTIINRDSKKARAVAEHFGCQSARTEELRDYDLLINCTAVEMPIHKQNLLPNTFVMDIHSRPKETVLLKHASKMGCKVIYGYEMFVEQAVGQFDLWFKEKKLSAKCRDLINSKVAEHLH